MTLLQIVRGGTSSCRMLRGALVFGALVAGASACSGLPGFTPGSVAANSMAGTSAGFAPAVRAAALLAFSEQTGEYPDSDLTPIGKTLYGVTRETVGYDCLCGTVYSLGANGKATLLHQFTGGNDGAEPSGDLTFANGVFYGVTAYGGGASGCGSSRLHALGCGTIYSITPSGKERVVYAFTDVTGYKPSGSVVYLHGKLYGVTPYGVSNQGTIWSFDLKTRTLTRLHQFFQDGAYAEGGLTLVGSTLFGTTSGYLEECPTTQYACGTVFSIRPDGSAYTVLHEFDFSDGASPFATVVAAGEYLYGTTTFGGKNCSSDGCGTLFEIDPHGHFTVLWYFGTHVGDGQNPLGNLALSHGALYGVTQYGGNGDCRSYENTCGAVFESGTVAKTERILYSFDESVGETPEAGVLVRGSSIYGTTYYGGPDHYGTLYRLDGISNRHDDFTDASAR